MHQSCVDKPLQGILIFTCPCSFFYNFVKKLLIFPCQLRGYRFPNHRNLRIFTDVRVLSKITFISINNSGQGFLHGRNVSCFRPHQHRFRHTSGDIVHFQFLIKRIEKSFWNRFNAIYVFQIPGKIFITIGKEKFCEGHWLNLHKVYFANRKGRWFC